MPIYNRQLNESPEIWKRVKQVFVVECLLKLFEYSANYDQLGVHYQAT